MITSTRPSATPAAAASGPLGIADFGKGIEPLPPQQTLRQALLAHVQGIDVDFSQLFFDPLHDFRIRSSVQITDHHVGLGYFADLQDFHGQAGVPNAATDQSRVENQRFHKAVPGTPQHPVVIRLGDAADG